MTSPRGHREVRARRNRRVLARRAALWGSRAFIAIAFLTGVPVFGPIILGIPPASKEALLLAMTRSSAAAMLALALLLVASKDSPAAWWSDDPRVVNWLTRRPWTFRGALVCISLAVLASLAGLIAPTTALAGRAAGLVGASCILAALLGWAGPRLLAWQDARHPTGGQSP